MVSSASYISKVKRLHNGRLPKIFSLYMKYGDFESNEKEIAAKYYFNLLMTDKEEKKKAKELGLI